MKGASDMMTALCFEPEKANMPPQTQNWRIAMQVLRFVLDAVRAEAFNEKRTLFLFGSYTIGKEKLFLEVAATLQQKVGQLDCFCTSARGLASCVRTG